MFYIMFFWLEPKEPKLPPFLVVKFKGVGESADFKASESSAKMFARKPKILTIGSLTASPNHFVRFRLSAQTTEVFTAPSLHFYASLSRGHFPLSPKGGRNPKYSLLISTTNRHKAGSA